MHKLKIFTLFLGDVVSLYASLFIALILRYGPAFYEQFLKAHVRPFSIIFIPWLIIFYIAGLYDIRQLHNGIDFLKVLMASIAVNAFVAIMLFYLVPAFGIAPKTNLFIFIIVFAIIEVLWRQAFNTMTSQGEAPNKIVLVGDGPTADEVAKTTAGNPQLGYAIARRLGEKEIAVKPSLLDEIIAEMKVDIVVVPRHLKQDAHLARSLYALFARGIIILDLATFYETVMRKVPLADLQEIWFIENIEGAARFYDPLKRAGEFLLALLLGIILLPLEILIALLIKLTSRGPVLIRQERVGAHGRVFTLYKFRSMVALAPDGQAETQGAQWATQGDKRVTPFGKFIRATHLDELPQFINLIRGDISFVGPRPERPEFVEKLKEQVPYYEVRLLVTPGVTGWAQLNHRADITIDDVKQKLQYDIYYLKNRSLVLDAAIVLKTVKSIFINPK